MEKTVKLWQVILATIGIGITVITAFVSQAKEIEGYKWQIELVKSQLSTVGSELGGIKQQLKEMNDTQTKILIQLENKADKDDKLRR